MELPGLVGEAYRQELYAGAGCCAGLNSWYNEPLKDRLPKKVNIEVNPLPSILQKFLAALGQEWISSDALVLTVYRFKSFLIQDGMDEEEVEYICYRCLKLLEESRSSRATSFMG
jgi:hypothetical protein